MNAAAIILCAGKGTRMNDDSKNKVCFDCAGTPTIKRIIDNMKKAGVSRFVVVVGHKAESVMSCLDGTDGVVYAYQKDQKGTGHAAMCGLCALKTMGYKGPVIVSMGDKIIATDAISDILSRAKDARSVWGVLPLESNFNGGRVVTVDGKPFGIVEFADAALMSLAEHSPENYKTALEKTGLNPKKAEKVYKKAMENPPSATFSLCGKTFSYKDALFAKYANAALYCFDLEAATEIIGNLGSNNAQGEVYLTDALEQFAKTDDAVIYEVKKSEHMLTYSTRPELREISKHFMRTASELIKAISDGEMDSDFCGLYGTDAKNQKERYCKLLNHFINEYGDKKVVITRSPGRVNLMGRHIDHRGGGINVIATDKDIVFVSAMRQDDTVNICNIDPNYQKKSFSISKTLGDKKYDSWLSYLSDENVVCALNESCGCWSNYVKSAVLRAQFENDLALCGMDMVAGGTIPVAAGLSSSSAIVVAVMEAVVSLNSLNISDRDFINLCGEGEWFVGSRGGAGDHAAMKCGKKDRIVHLMFKPFEVGGCANFSDKYAVIVANSMIKAKKSEGSKDVFNSKIASYEFAFMLIKRLFPEYDLVEFRDIAKIRPFSAIYDILKAIPETLTRGAIKALLPEYSDSIARIFANHKDPGIYNIRGVALFGISECVRAQKCRDLLEEGNYTALGEMMKISHNGDRLQNAPITDEMLDGLSKNNTDISLVSGDYGCSIEKIDYLCDILDSTPGVLGAELVGAGLGGCVIALVEKDKAQSIISVINEQYYDKYGFERSAGIYSASHGSKVIF